MTGLDAAEGVGAKFANDGGRFGVESASVEVVAEEIEARGTDLLAGGWGWWEVTGLATGCRAGIVPTRTGLVDEARRAEFLVERLDLVGFTWIWPDFGAGGWSPESGDIRSGEVSGGEDGCEAQAGDVRRGLGA